MMQPPPSSSSLSHSIKFPPSKLLSHPLFPRKPLHRRLLAKPAAPSAPLAGGDTSATATADAALLSLLRSRDTDAAFAAYSRLTHLPGPVPLSRLLSQLSYQNTPAALARAQSLLRRVRDARELRRLDANSLGLLAVTAARHGAAPYALSVLRSMLRSGYLPHVKAWSAVAARLGSAPDDGPMEALRLFDSVIHRIRSAGAVASDARPDAAAFNAVLNACANIGDIPRFRQILEEMPEFNATPDVLTFNIMIKLCARSNRKDLLVSTLELIIFRGLVPCITTFHSLVAAYVGFSDLDTAEKLVQAMRESRNDICAVLRDCNGDSTIVQPDNGTEAHDILENLVNYNHRNNPPPLLPKTHTPDCRMYTTLMKGYLKEGRSDDVVRMIRAMQREADPASHPDHVTYTTVITALVKAGTMDRAHRVLAEMDQAGVPANRITYNVLLKGYCHQLQIGKAKELIRDMAVDKGIEPNVVSYNILIDGCILVDDSAGALAFFNEMRERGIAPSKVSYTTLMKAFALSGQPRLAHKVFDEMGKDPRVKVDRAAWNMLIEGYCRLGLVEEAKKVVERMKEDGFQPDIATYGSLANGIALARKPGEALLLWNEVKERCTASPPLKPDEGLLDALADVCVRAAFFRKALEIVACMEEFGISPNKTKYKRIYVEMHSRMFTSKHASQARQMRRTERKRAAEAFKFWLGLPNSYYGSEWRLEPVEGGD